MQIGHIEGATRVIGKSQGYRGLPLRDVTLNSTVNGEGTPAMQTAWIPDQDDIERICAGAPIYLTVLGTSHPPVMIEVGNPPVEEVTP
jgi:hypothetical protein